MNLAAATFSIITECPRCAGFERAFSGKGHINRGLCLRCDGTLRSVIVRPVADMVEMPRAEAVRVIQIVLASIGAPAPRDESGRTVSPFGFECYGAMDVMLMAASVLSRCDSTVRARAYAAITAKIRSTAWRTGTAEDRVDLLDGKIADSTGLAIDDVAEWANATRATAAA